MKFYDLYIKDTNCEFDDYSLTHPTTKMSWRQMTDFLRHEEDWDFKVMPHGSLPTLERPIMFGTTFGDVGGPQATASGQLIP